MKLNWGKSIAIVMVCFMAFIITLTSQMMAKSAELESEDYYQKEVNYEQEIQAQKNAQKNDIMSFKQEEDHCVISIDQAHQLEKVYVHFIRPNNQEQDKTYEFTGSNTYLIPTKSLEKGVYKIEIHYEVAGADCLIKEEITI